LYLKDTNGGQEEKVIPQDGPDRFPTDWSRDGKYVLYGRGPDLWFLTFPKLRATQFLKAASTLKSGRFSPDGKWVAYSSNESWTMGDLCNLFSRSTWEMAGVEHRRRSAQMAGRW